MQRFIRVVSEGLQHIALFAEPLDDDLKGFKGHEPDEHADGGFGNFIRIDFVVHNVVPPVDFELK